MSKNLNPTVTALSQEYHATYAWYLVECGICKNLPDGDPRYDAAERRVDVAMDELKRIHGLVLSTAATSPHEVLMKLRIADRWGDLSKLVAEQDPEKPDSMMNIEDVIIVSAIRDLERVLGAVPSYAVAAE